MRMNKQTKQIYGFCHFCRENFSVHEFNHFCRENFGCTWVLLLLQGKFWVYMGFVDKSRKWLLPEEALYLMETVSRYNFVRYYDNSV